MQTIAPLIFIAIVIVGIVVICGVLIALVHGEDDDDDGPVDFSWVEYNKAFGRDKSDE